MSEDNTEIQELKKRVEKLESQIIFLSRRMGIDMQQAPKPEISPAVADLIREGKKMEAIREFINETGAGLKDAKTIIESHMK